MFGVLLSVCLVPAVVSIIVTDPPPTSTEYNYSYNVVDPRIGDAKSLHEIRRGDLVTGSYTVIDPDGTQRVVEYTADSRRGFKAIVHSKPLAVAAPFHHVLRDHYVPRGNSRYLNQYYSAHTLYSGHPLSESHVIKPDHIRQKNKKITDNKQIRYFTPANEIKTKPVMFKRGEYFAPNN